MQSLFHRKYKDFMYGQVFKTTVQFGNHFHCHTTTGCKHWSGIYAYEWNARLNKASEHFVLISTCLCTSPISTGMYVAKLWSCITQIRIGKCNSIFFENVICTHCKNESCNLIRVWLCCIMSVRHKCTFIQWYGVLSVCQHSIQ